MPLAQSFFCINLEEKEIYSLFEWNIWTAHSSKQDRFDICNHSAAVINDQCFFVSNIHRIKNSSMEKYVMVFPRLRRKWIWSIFKFCLADFSSSLSTCFHPARLFLPLISALTGTLDWGLVTRWAHLTSYYLPTTQREGFLPNPRSYIHVISRCILVIKLLPFCHQKWSEIFKYLLLGLFRSKSPNSKISYVELILDNTSYSEMTICYIFQCIDTWMAKHHITGLQQWLVPVRLVGITRPR